MSNSLVLPQTLPNTPEVALVCFRAHDGGIQSELFAPALVVPLVGQHYTAFTVAIYASWQTRLGGSAGCSPAVSAKVPLRWQ